MAYVQRRVEVETVNETVAEVKGQALVGTVRYAITYGNRRAWQHTRKKVEDYGVVDTSADKLVQVEVLILNETLAEKKAQACRHTC